MATTAEESGEGFYKPWGRRASLTPRKTYSGDSAIVYKRKKHYFTIKDVARVQEKVDINTQDDPDFTWWQKILNWLALYMLSKITGALSLDEGVGEIAWYAVNEFWDRLVRRIAGDNSFISGSVEAYKSALTEAVKAYLEGDSSLAEKLYDDLLNL